ncbi:hypothetical protein ACQ4PT_028574 [Festuca glaucescens]
MENPPADTAASGRRLRTRGTEAAAPARSAALRAKRDGGTRAAAVQVRMEDPIYDTVTEEDYAALVARRRKDVGAFIIDDDGLGYIDDGWEEDWTHRALPSSSDKGSGDEDGAPRKWKQPRPPQAKRPPQQSAAAASLSAAAAMMGKQRLSSMFTSSVLKKPGSDRAPATDSIVDDVIAEFAPDENDREERRRRVGGISAPTPLPPLVAPIKPVKAAVYAEMEVRSDNGYEPDVVSDHGNDMDVEPILEVELKPDVEMQPNLEATPGSSAELADVNKNLEELKQDANGEVKIEKAHRLNAKIKAEGSMNRDVSNATAGWMKICDEGENAGGKGFHSFCVVVKNMQRCIYAIPSSSVFPRDSISRTEKNSTNSDALPLLRATLHELASGLKSEVAEKLSNLNISNFVMTPVKRNYAFERTDIPTGEQYVLKINYPYKDTAVPSDLRGEHFHVLLGTNNSALELFLVKRKIKGPSWLSISKFVTCPSTQRVSWCKFEVTVDCPKDISVLTASATLEVPPAVVAAVNLKTIINEKHNVHEIVSASAICCHRVKIDSPMRSEDWQKRGMISHFTIMRELEGSIFPIGLNKEASDRNQKAGSNVLALESR